MATSPEITNSPESKEVRIGTDELEHLFDFWRGKREHTSPFVADGIEYIRLLNQAAGANSFQLDGLKPLINEAIMTLSEGAQAACEEYQRWFQENPNKVFFVEGKIVTTVSDVKLVGYDIYPFVDGQVILDRLDAKWVVDEGDKI